MEERLQKVMAQAGVGSRRYSEELIRQGRVQVNGRVAQLGDKVDPQKDMILVNGKQLAAPEKKLYIMLHKPRGVLSDADETGTGRTTVLDLVDIDAHLYPIGRLDKQSMGLILLTNDGDLAHRLTHPRYGHHKVYRVKVAGYPTRETLKKWEQGVELEDGMTAPTQVKLEKHEDEATWLQITMREGRKRQIRRVAAQLGHEVLHLSREQIGPIHLGNLELGKWRHLTDQEVSALRKQAFRRKSSSSSKRSQESGKHRPTKRTPKRRHSK